MIQTQASDRERLEALILYVSHKCERDPRFGKTKLNKLLFYADSVALGVLGRPITDWPYIKDHFGPVPQDYAMILERMVEDRRLEIKRAPNSDTLQVPTARVGAPLHVFTSAQMHLVDLVLDVYWEHGAEEISFESHTDIPGWETMARGHFVQVRPRLLPPRVPTPSPSTIRAAMDLLMHRNADLMRRLA